MSKKSTNSQEEQEPDSLKPLIGGQAPQSFDELWAAYDPRKEPLDLEVLKEWEEDGVVLQVVRFRVGIFKGQKSMMAGVYGYPKDAEPVPGLVQLHGGGQYAHSNACLTNAKRGYATISVSWGGRIDAPDYQVSPEEVKLYWAGKTGDPAYRVITDWGALDAYHHPSRNEQNSNWADLEPAPWTCDPVASPRNSNWFLCTLAARRALSFLEEQPQVDRERLGAYGHSMGGKLAVMLAASDARVKVVAPSCGGISDRKGDTLQGRTIGDDAYLRRISCPIFFLSPSNDFHGLINDLPTAIEEIQTSDWRIASAPHHNHQDTAEYEVATQVWFDQHLKGCSITPETPTTILNLETENAVPYLTVAPDASRPVLAVDIYYTQHGQMDGQPDDRDNSMNRYWHHAKATQNGDCLGAELPLHSTDKPLWAYANVTYALDAPVSGAGYYYRSYTTASFCLSSLPQLVSPAQLKAAGVQPGLSPSSLIESFAGDWEKEWYFYLPTPWMRRTHKVYDPVWAATPKATLYLEVLVTQPSKLVVGIDSFAVECDLIGDDAWQSIELSPGDFCDANGGNLPSWEGIKDLYLAEEKTLRDGEACRKFGAPWPEAKPVFRSLQWKSAGS